MLKGDDASDVLRAVNDEADYRVLRRLDVCDGRTGVGRKDGTEIAVVVDLETTGIGEDDAIIELAMRRFRYDPDGEVVAIDRRYSWLEDPGRALPQDIVRLTGIRDGDLAGKRIDEEVALRLLRSATFVCAHNASFDRPRLERRLPGAAGLAWACSCHDVDWRARGFDGRALGWLLAQVGYYHGAHRAGDDVDAVIELLRHRTDDAGTILAEMLAAASAPSWRFVAVGAAFELKDRLRARGYRWDARRKAWWREVPDARRVEEEWWLAGHVYSAEANPKALGPRVERLTWHERYAGASA